MKSLFYIICLVLFSCKSREKEVISQEKNDINSKVIVIKDHKSLDNEKVLISFPLKFKLYKDSETLDKLFLITNDNKLLYQITDYMFFDENNRPIYDIEKKSTSNQDLIVNVVIKDIPVLKSDFDRNSTSLIDDLDKTGTVKYNYVEFKQKNPLVFKQLNKIGDTIIVRSFSKNKLLNEKRIRVNW
ncbi:hypothetical protein BBI01_21995 [Chryseobacterium artocarpi]|uniref:Uncharacterized protein n=1 Tax=Chryseobacterium artocarpi TaxID=1414727 RepID=A0A1B8ZYK6_9FLAO|nr:hypothetical protein [Chryseobacterium artocarpi]OCA76688.1 hypothetical protein BBI01_21995 [Chryseobacterium artocarpi]